MLTTLFKFFFEICLLRRKPQDLPGSPELLAVSAVAYLLISSLLMLVSATPKQALLSSMVELALVALITLVILQLNRHFERLQQTLTAIFGTGCIISLFAIPLLYSGLLTQPGGLLQAVAVLGYLALLFWNILVMGHILRHALTTTLGFGIVFAIIYIVITSTLISVLLPILESQ